MASVALGAHPGAAVSVLILALSGVLASGAKLGAQEDVDGSGAEPESGLRRTPVAPATSGRLRTALAEQFGGGDQYREVVDRYVGDEVSTARLPEDLASICGDLLHGLSRYTEGRSVDAMAWWQYSSLANWGRRPARACARCSP